MVWACFFFFFFEYCKNKPKMDEWIFFSVPKITTIWLNMLANSFLFFLFIRWWRWWVVDYDGLVFCWCYCLNASLIYKGANNDDGNNNNSKRMSIISSPSFILFKVKLFLSIEFFSTKKKSSIKLEKIFIHSLMHLKLDFFFIILFPFRIEWMMNVMLIAAIFISHT